MLPEAEKPENRALRESDRQERGTERDGRGGGVRVRVSGYGYRESGPRSGTTGIKPIKTAEPRRQEMTVINSAL